ncbi:unnamed protein product [Ophioblennius macclurei]
MNEKVDDRNDEKAELYTSLPSTSKSTPLNSSTGQTGSVTEVSCFSEHVFTEDAELSSSDICVHVFPHSTTDLPGYNLQTQSMSESPTVASICNYSVVEKEQPRPLCGEESRPFKSQESLQTSTVHNQPKEDDLCAAVLLACLFCRPVDCVLATLKGCNGCAWWLCQWLCGCESTALRPVAEAARHCDVCGCLGLRCFLCECDCVCDVCLQATECLDLGMEISQMLYH